MKSKASYRVTKDELTYILSEYFSPKGFVVMDTHDLTFFTDSAEEYYTDVDHIIFKMSN